MYLAYMVEYDCTSVIQEMRTNVSQFLEYKSVIWSMVALLCTCNIQCALKNKLLAFIKFVDGRKLNVIN